MGQQQLLETKLLFNHTEWIFHLGPDMSFGTLQPVEQLPFFCLQ